VLTMSAREKSAVPAQQHGPPSPPRRLVVYAILRAAGSLRRLSADIFEQYGITLSAAGLLVELRRKRATIPEILPTQHEAN
jgi:hypothetical protein